MKRLLVIAGALFAFSIFTESCASSKNTNRPPVHPRPPRKWVNAPEKAPTAPVIEHIG